MGISNTSIIDVGFQNESVQWFAGVFGFSASSFNIVYNEFRTECPLDCSNHGTCNNEKRKCECNIGWGGAACDFEVPTTPKDAWVSKTLAKSAWHYVYFQVPERTTAFKLNVEELNTNSDVDLYIKRGEIPSFAIWDYAGMYSSLLSI